MKRLFVGSFTAIAAVLVCSASISLAWYESDHTLYIDTFDVSLSKIGDFAISLDGINYKDRIEQSELKQVEYFKPVSSMCSSTWMNALSDYPVFYGDYDYSKMKFVSDVSGQTPGYVEPELIPAQNGYFSQEFYLRSEANYTAIIDPSTTFYADEEKNAVTAKNLAITHPEMGTEAEIKAKLDGLINSARISFLIMDEYKSVYYYKIIDPTRNNDVYLGGILDGDLSGTFDYWTKSDKSKYEILFGEVNDRSLIKYKYNESYVPTPYEDRTWYTASHEAKTNIIDFENSTGLNIKKEVSCSLAENETLVNENLLGGKGLTDEEKASLVYIPLKAYRPTRVVISIYFEGWDYDNLNSTMNGSFKSNIVFNVVDPNIVL